MGTANTLILLDKEGVAEYLGIHPYSVWRLVREKRLPQGVRHRGDKKKYWAQASLDVYVQRLDDEAFRVHEAYVKGK